MKLAPFCFFDGIELAEDFAYLKNSTIVLDGELYNIKLVAVVPCEPDAKLDVFARIRSALNPTGFLQPSFNDVMQYVRTVPFASYDVYIITTKKNGKRIDVQFIPLITYATEKGELGQGFQISLRSDQNK